MHIFSYYSSFSAHHVESLIEFVVEPTLARYSISTEPRFAGTCEPSNCIGTIGVAVAVVLSLCALVNVCAR